MPDDLPAYSGTCCRKCGFPAAKYRYCTSDCKDDGTGEIDSGSPRLNRPATPHQHRTCERCGFEWMEQTMIGEM